MPSVRSTKRRKKNNDQDDNNSSELHELHSFYTKQLKNLLTQERIKKDSAMSLIVSGANPNARGSNGNSLLHILSNKNNNLNGCNNEDIKKLVELFNAEINIENDDGFTPYKCLLAANNFKVYEALVLLRLGANPNETFPDGNTLRDHLLSDKNADHYYTLLEIDSLHKTYENKLKIARSDFLHLLIFLVFHKKNIQHKNQSYLASLPWELIVKIISYLDLSAVKKSKEECSQLAIEVFNQFDKIKTMANESGGINVLQLYNRKERCTKFIFFNAASKNEVLSQTDKRELYQEKETKSGLK